MSTHMLHTYVCTCTNKLLRPDKILPVKAFSFSHPLEIQERIIMDTCSSELYTKIHRNVDHFSYKPTWSKKATHINSRHQTGSVRPRVDLKVTCIHNSLKRSYRPWAADEKLTYLQIYRNLRFPCRARSSDYAGRIRTFPIPVIRRIPKQSDKRLICVPGQRRQRITSVDELLVITTYIYTQEGEGRSFLFKSVEYLFE